VRKFIEYSEQRDPKLLGPGLKVTIAAGEIVAGEAFRSIRDFRTDIGVCGRDKIAPAPYQPPIRIVRQCADLGHRPDRRRGGLR
jgi:hypothetical protein